MDKNDPITYEWRTKRLALAMEKFGSSRITELASIAALVAPPGGSLLELMSGSGFVARYMGEQFDQVDKSDLMAKYLNSNIIKCEAATLDNRNIRYKTYDNCVCHAGFHHLLPYESPSPKTEQIVEHRVAALSRWRKILSPGGKLIIGDVAATSSSSPTPSIEEKTVFENYPTLYSKFETLPLERVDDKLAQRTNPAMFFDNFVSNHSYTGHSAYFETVESLAGLMTSSGFSNVKSFVRFTPWIFPSRDAAVWFVYNLFGVGDLDSSSVSSPSSVSRKLVNQAIERYLGVQEMKNEIFVVGWKLLYAVGEA